MNKDIGVFVGAILLMVAAYTLHMQNEKIAHNEQRLSECIEALRAVGGTVRK